MGLSWVLCGVPKELEVSHRIQSRVTTTGNVQGHVSIHGRRARTPSRRWAGLQFYLVAAG